MPVTAQAPVGARDFVGLIRSHHKQRMHRHRRRVLRRRLRFICLRHGPRVRFVAGEALAGVAFVVYLVSVFAFVSLLAV